MSFLDCINEAESEGTITGDQAERARGLYKEFLKQKYGKKANAEAEAGASTFDALQADIVQRKRRAVLQHQAQKDRLNEVLQYDVDHTGQVLGDIIDKGGRGLFRTIDYEARRKGILTQAHSKSSQRHRAEPLMSCVFNLIMQEGISQSALIGVCLSHMIVRLYEKAP